MTKLNPGAQTGGNQRQSDLAYEKIRRAIIHCYLAPGAEVSEGGLANSFGFGKAAVRAALMHLSQEGLVQVIPRRGYLVTAITLKDILEVFELRMILEPATARLAAGKVDGQKLIEADARWSEGYRGPGDDIDDAALWANKEFHLTIARATGNARLVEMQSRVLDETDRLIYLGLPLANERSEIREGHKPLIDALVRGAPADAAAAAAKHVSAAKAIAVEAVMSLPSIMQTAIAVPNRKTGTER